MKRSSLALLGALFVAGAIPAAASAQEIQLGVTATPIVAPVCPANAQGTECTIVLPEATAYETLSDGSSDPATVTKPGVISSFTVGVSEISSNAKTRASYVSSLDSAYGGSPAVRMVVLRPIGKSTSYRWQVAAQTPSFSLSDYLGSVVQFPLIAPVPVVRGELIGITVPTWAPILSIELSTSKFAYRQSYSKDCNGSSREDFAQLRIGLVATYGCDYTGTRVEYSATETTSPPTTS